MESKCTTLTWNTLPQDIRCEESVLKFKKTTVNVDFFACINFRGFMKMGNFTYIKICVLSMTSSLGYYKSNFRWVHIIVDI